MSPGITVLHPDLTSAYLVRMSIKKSSASRALRWPLLLAGAILCATATPLTAHDINDRLGIGGVAAAAWQCQELSEGAGSWMHAVEHCLSGLTSTTDRPGATGSTLN